MVGPTFGLEELAGRKVIALFDRAEARDFVDVYVLASRFPKAMLLERAATLDGGFDQIVFADMIDTLARFADHDLPVPSEAVHDLRAFFSEWAAELRAV